MARTVSTWGDNGPRPVPNPANDALFANLVLTASVEVAAPARAAYDLVSDITRIGDLSPECVSASWVGDGVFEGTNRIAFGEDEYVWIRPCRVTADVPGSRWAYAVGDRWDGSPASEWEWSFASLPDGGCRVTQTFRHVPDGLSGLRSQADTDPANAAAFVAARTASLREGMRTTLARLRDLLEPPRSL
jgi:uncharacterized protein YndB with AHSA1/START domain